MAHLAAIYENALSYHAFSVGDELQVVVLLRNSIIFKAMPQPEWTEKHFNPEELAHCMRVAQVRRNPMQRQLIISKALR